MKIFLDADFTFDTPKEVTTQHFKNVPLETFYHLRRRLFEIHNKDMLSVDVYYHETKERVENLCWFFETEYNWQADLWNHDGI